MNDARGSRAARALGSALACCASLAVASCGAAQVPRCDRSEAIRVHVHPAKHLNPDRAGLPRSVVVRLFQLGDARAFEGSSFERVWTGAAEGLSKPEQLIALPGREQSHALRRDPAAQYLGVAANFREREGDSQWRALVRLPAAQNVCEQWVNERPPLELTLADYALHLR